MSAEYAASPRPRYAEPALRRARLSLVPDRLAEPGEARRAPFLALVALLLAGGVAGLLAFNTSMQQASFRATRLEQRAATLAAQKQSLGLALAADRDPQRVAARARALGMVVPPDPAFIRLSDGAVLGNPTPATADGTMRITPLPAGKPAALEPPPLVVHVPAPTPTPATAATGPTSGPTSGATPAASPTP